MREDRRKFLKLFGASSAAMATMSTTKGTEIEVVKNPGGTGKVPTAPDLHSYYDVQDWILYAREDIGYWDFQANFGNANDSLRKSFFTTDRYASGSSQGSPELYTNLCYPGRLDAPEVFLCDRVGLIFSPDTNPELRTKFVSSTTVILWIGNKSYFKRPAAFFFSVNDVLADQKRNPEVPSRAMQSLTVPLLIEHGQRFYVETITCMRMGWQDWPNGKMYGDEIRCWAVLGGKIARGVS